MSTSDSQLESRPPAFPARGRRAIVEVSVLLSSAAYFVFSEAVHSEFANAAYRHLLWTSFWKHPNAPLIEAARVSVPGVLSILAIACFAMVSAMLMRRAIGSRAPDRLPEIVVYACAAIVVPPLAIAALFWPDGRGYVSTPILLSVSVVLNVILLVAARRRPRLQAVSRPPRAATGERPLWVALFAASTALYALVLAVLALSSLRGFDSLAYHLPRAAAWLHHGRLTTNVEESATFFFPANAEFFIRWVLASGSDRFAFVPAFVEAALCIYVIYKIAREIGQTHTAATVAALSACSCVLLSFIATSGYIDAFTALMLLLATLFLIRSLKTDLNDTAATVALGTAIGLSLGSKYSAIQPALVISGVWLWRLFRQHLRLYEGCFGFLDFRAVGRAIVRFAIPVVLCSAYWYVRNAVEHGNPLFPFAMLGWPGLTNDILIYVRPEVASPYRWATYPWREMSSMSFDDYIGGVFGGVAVIGLLHAVLERGVNRARDTVAFIVIVTFALWLVTGNFVPRYGIFPLLLTFVFVGDLWAAYDSMILRTATFLTFVATLFIFGRGFATQAIYVTVAGRPRYGVPRIVDRLAPASILNGTSSLANYDLMGSDYRHDVIALFESARPDDLPRFHPDYILLKDEDVARFKRLHGLELVAKSDPDDLAHTSLWRVGYARIARPAPKVTIRP